MNRNIALLIYANPDHYPTLLNMVSLLKFHGFRIILICRNIGEPSHLYPKEVTVYRLGKGGSFSEKEGQSFINKAAELICFFLKTFFLIYRHNCRIVYAFEIHAFLFGTFLKILSGFDQICLIYHNFDLYASYKDISLRSIIKIIELKFSKNADKLIFPSFERAVHFKNQAKLTKKPLIVMNVPLQKNESIPSYIFEALRKKVNYTNSKIVIFIGSINESRAIIEIIRSIVFWPKDLVLVLVGYCAKDFCMLINNEVKKLKISERVIIIPPVEYNQTFFYVEGAFLGVALYQGNDLNIRLMGGAANKLFQYMACGVPPLVLETADMKRILDNSFVYFVKSLLPEEIARVVNEAVANPQEHKIKSELCRKMHLEKFNLEVQFEPVLEYLKSHLKNG